MIEIHHFSEAYQYYKQNKFDLRLLQDQAAVMFGLCQNLPSTISTPLDITQSDLDLLSQQPEAMQDYAFTLGGYVYVCETEEDLLQILGCDFEWAESHDGNWPNVTDIAMSWDASNYLDETSDDPQWVIFLLCWNNAGGPVYYVPKQLWIKARVTEHIALTNPTLQT